MKNIRKANSINVYCKLRPASINESVSDGQSNIYFEDKSIRLKGINEEVVNEFTFDKIFPPDSSQSDVFTVAAEPIIKSVLQGYNGTIFAYGHTSSGKTYTMEGPQSLEDTEQRGIIPRTLEYIFNHSSRSDPNLKVSIKVSYLEIYNEKILDLLDISKTNLIIKDDKTRGIYVQDATEIEAKGVEHVEKIHRLGKENRKIAGTRMNERSSRSHTIFIIQISQQDSKAKITKHSKLYLVDLAGSEKVRETQASGQQLEEAKNINKSLTSLGIVINALTEKHEKAHIPYRDSKLTRLLQESLGGNAKTTLILACTLCKFHERETLSTLRFGLRAKKIQNSPRINQENDPKALNLMLENAEKKIKLQESVISTLRCQIDAMSIEMTSIKNSTIIDEKNDSFALEYSPILSGEKNRDSIFQIDEKEFEKSKTCHLEVQVKDLRRQVADYKSKIDEMSEELELMEKFQSTVIIAVDDMKNRKMKFGKWKPKALDGNSILPELVDNEINVKRKVEQIKNSKETETEDLLVTKKRVSFGNIHPDDNSFDGTNLHALDLNIGRRLTSLSRSMGFELFQSQKYPNSIESIKDLKIMKEMKRNLMKLQNKYIPESKPLVDLNECQGELDKLKSENNKQKRNSHIQPLRFSAFMNKLVES